MFDTEAIRTRLLGVQPASTDPTVAYRLPNGSGGSFVAGGNAVALATPAVVAASVFSDSTLLPYQRLGRFEFDPTTHLPRFVPVVPNDPSLVGKHVVVLVHGWAADYSYWVQDVANQSPSKTLTWWDTDPSQPGYSLAANLQANNQSDSTLGPNSYWLLHGYDVNAIDTADVGLAENIASRAAQTDPQTVVLAFTWLETQQRPPSPIPTSRKPRPPSTASVLPTRSGRSSAVSRPSAGRSSSSATATARRWPRSRPCRWPRRTADTFNVRQLTILDSPEDQSEVSNELWADNFNWYYIQDLNTNRQDPQRGFRRQLHLLSRRAVQQYHDSERKYVEPGRGRSARRPPTSISSTDTATRPSGTTGRANRRSPMGKRSASSGPRSSPVTRGRNSHRPTWEQATRSRGRARASTRASSSS